MTTVYYAKSSDFQEKISLKKLLLQLPPSFEERALRYHFAQDAYNFVLGRLLLKKGVECLNLPIANLAKMRYNKEEKPLVNGLSFSISHSKDLVACAFAATGKIGLDVEFPRKIKREHFAHYFNEKEWATIQADKSMHTFYKYWTQKEAILKANGMGLAHLLAIRIENDSLAYFGEKGKQFYLKSFWFDQETAYACLCTDWETEITTQKISAKDFGGVNFY